MADDFGPFDGVPWNQAQWFGVAKAWAPSGILAAPVAGVASGPFGASSSGLSLTIAAAGNAAWIRGAGYVPDTNKTFAVPANTNATLSRRDRIVFRRDLVAKTVTIAQVQGTPAGTPVAPALTQSDTGTWEEPICSFLVPPNSGTTLSGFVDERTWVDPAGDGHATYYDEGNGGGTIGTSITNPTDSATLSLPAGTYDVDYLMHFALSVAAERAYTLYLRNGGSTLTSATFPVATIGNGSAGSFTFNAFRRITLASAGTLTLAASADGTGGTQSMGLNMIRARRVA